MIFIPLKCHTSLILFIPVAPIAEVKAEKDDDGEVEMTSSRPSRSSRAVAVKKEEKEEPPVVTKSGRKVVRPQSPPSVNTTAAERSPGKQKVDVIDGLMFWKSHRNCWRGNKHQHSFCWKIISYNCK